MKMTKITYSGPDDQRNTEVGRALDTGGLLEQGETYELPAELADKLLTTSPWWHPHDDGLDTLKVAELEEIASELDVDRKGLNKTELRDAIRAARSAARAAEAEASAESGDGSQEAAAGSLDTETEATDGTR